MNLSKKLTNLFNLIINKQQLTYQNIINSGISDTELQELIDANIIVKNETEYQLSSVQELFAYSIYLINIKEIDKAIECLDICHNIDPNNYEISLQMLQACVKRKKYDRAFTVFSWIDNDTFRKKQKDINLYLYLLSLNCNYPEKYRSRVINMKYDDILLNSETNTNAVNQNQMRISILQGKLTQAIKIFNESVSKETKSITERYLLQELLNQAKEHEERKRLAMIRLVENKDYKGIISLIEIKQTIGKVNLYYSFIYYITKKILLIEKNRTIPKIKVANTTNLKEALLGDNYQLALQLNQERNLLAGDQDDKNIVTILLKQINLLISKIQIEQEKKLQEFRYIASLLDVGRQEEAIKLIRDYLKSINKTNYEYLILNLIKINYLNETNFSNIVTILYTLDNPKSKLNLEFYITDFYDNIKENKLDIAKIYYDIIINYLPLVDQSTISEEVRNQISDMNKIMTKIQEEKDFIQKQIDFLKDSDDATIILTDIEKERREIILGLVRNKSNLKIFCIDGQEPKKLVFRYREKSDISNIEKKHLFTEGLKTYFAKDYEQSIKIHQQLLKIANFAKPRLYAILAFSYLNQGNIEPAIKYLTIAKELNKCGANANKIYNFGKLITFLKDEKFVENKVKLESYIHRFDATLKNYELEDLEEIADYLIETGSSIEDGITTFRLNLNQTSILKLLYAKAYYSNGNYDEGDILYQEVEQTRQKSPTVLTLLDAIESNKLMYKRKNT